MRFFILSLRRNILPFTFVIIAICLVIFSKSNLTAATNGLTLWATCVVPSLFPFFVVTNLLSYTKVVFFTGKILDKIMRPLFNVPGIGGFAFVMGLISGYPVGAKIVSDFRKDGLVTKDEGERMLAFTNNSGPLFILSSVGIGLLGDSKTGLLLLCTHILSCITVGIILGQFSKERDIQFRKKYNKKYCKLDLKTQSHTFSKDLNNYDYSSNKTVSFRNLGGFLGKSINESISTILLIGGFVVIFSVLISILNQSHVLDFIGNAFKPLLGFIGFDFSFAKPLVSGIIELTNGINLVTDVNIKAISQNVILCAFLLGFGGLSVFLQVFSIVAKTDLSMKKYFLGKCMQGIFAGIYTFIALKCIPFINLDLIETSSNISTSISQTNSTIFSFFYNFGILVIGIMFVILIFNLFNRFCNMNKT